MARKYWLVLSFILTAVLAPSLSHAACTITGVVVRVTNYEDAYSGTGGYIYLRTSSLAPSYYYLVSNDDDMVSNLTAYMNSGRTVSINGDIAACPAAPVAGGAAWLGTLNYFFNP